MTSLLTKDNLFIRREALKIWKNKKGLNATYKSLLKIFVIAEDTECSEAVCEVLGAQ